MTGGLMQLVAYGSQDIYLTGQPQVTFFKHVYRRYTNFSMEAISQTFTGNADFGRKVSALLSRNGDLAYKMYVEIDLPSVEVRPGCQFRWLDNIGHLLLKTVEIEIGGQKIDRHYSEWLQIYSELNLPTGLREGYNKMIGNVPELTSVYDNRYAGAVVPPGARSMFTPKYTLFVPLVFWCNTNPGLALPLISMQYHEAKINIEFRDSASCSWSSGGPVTIPSLDSATLYVDYVYLDADERRRFAQFAHEYLITQLQYSGEESVAGNGPKIKMAYNHPCKELIWVLQRSCYTDPSHPDTVANKGMQPFNFTTDWDNAYADDSTYVQTVQDIDDTVNPGDNLSLYGTNTGIPANSLKVAIPILSTKITRQNPVMRAKIQLNGADRFSERVGSYFDLVQPFQHHDNVPKAPGINVYSFALRPSEQQPSGTCNMSRIDTCMLQLSLQNVPNSSVLPASRLRSDIPKAAFQGVIKVFAVNYNVLRILSGMAGIAYSS